MRKRRIEEGLEEGLDEIEKDWGRMGRERKRLKKIELDKEEKYKKNWYIYIIILL